MAAQAFKPSTWNWTLIAVLLVGYLVLTGRNLLTEDPFS